MSIIYRRDDTDGHPGSFNPEFVCDGCGERIVGSGNVYWLVHAPSDIDPRVWHSHKACASFGEQIKAEFGRPESVVMWEELRKWLLQLTHNLQEE